MRIHGRLKTLEKKSRRSARCAECRARLDGVPDPDTEFNVYLPGVSGPPKPVDHSKDYCLTCGRRLVLWLELPKVRSTRGE